MKRLNYRATDPDPETTDNINELGCLVHNQVVDYMTVVGGGQSGFGDTIILLMHNHVIGDTIMLLVYNHIVETDGRPSLRIVRIYVAVPNNRASLETHPIVHGIYTHLSEIFLPVTMDVKIKKRLNYGTTDTEPENTDGRYALAQKNKKV